MSNWHLTEAYAFYVLIVMPPLNLVETQMNREDENEAVAYVEKHSLTL